MAEQTIEVRAFPSSERLNEAMQVQLDEIYERVLTSDAVAAACAAYREAQERVSALKRAQTSLTARAKQIFEELRALTASVRMSLIEAHAKGTKSRDLSEAIESVARLEREHKIISQANSHTLERLLPEADIRELGLAAEYCRVQADALRQVVAERIQRTAQLMADAAAYEGEIAFDPLKTLSGELQLQAAELDRKAENYRRWKGEREESYSKLCRELDAMGSLR
jgi:hypothetical protein